MIFNSWGGSVLQDEKVLEICYMTTCSSSIVVLYTKNGPKGELYIFFNHNSFFFFFKKKHHSWATSLSQGFPRSEALAVIEHDRYCFPHFIKGGTERPAGPFEPVAICLPAAMLSDRSGLLHPHAGLGWSPALQTRAENGCREKALWFARPDLPGQTTSSSTPTVPAVRSPLLPL